MNKWVKVVEAADLDDDKLYFIAGRPVSEHGQLRFQTIASRKTAWSTKPGIAAKFKGSTLRKALAERKELVAVEVPKDADTRWKARAIRRKNPYA